MTYITFYIIWSEYVQFIPHIKLNHGLGARDNVTNIILFNQEYLHDPMQSLIQEIEKP